MSIYSKVACFAGGTLFGSVGIKMLSKESAKKYYTVAAAAGLRAKDALMKTVTVVQENAADVLAEAKEINEERAARKEAEAAAAEVIETETEADAEAEGEDL